MHAPRASPRVRAGRQRGAFAAALLLPLLLLLLQPAPAAAQAPASNSSSEAEALLTFWQGLSARTQGSAILQDWESRADQDPCADGWAGVICACDALPSRALAAACNSSMAASGGSAQPPRIVGLDLGPLTTGGGGKLRGSITSALGSLSQLVFLDLSDNELTGTVPEELVALTQLQWLLLDGNQLSGPLPAFLGQLPSLKQARLQDNSFAGPVPSAWCSNGAVYELERNPMLCGTVPSCLVSSGRVGSIASTYLSLSALASASSSGTGGACDSTPPDCDPDVPCVIWTPAFWASRSAVAFNFTGFIDYESGIRRYEWGLGSAPGRADVVPLSPVTATRVLKDIRFSGGTQKMFVTPVVHTLNSISLLDGESYYVTLVAWNGAGPPLSYNRSSKPVLVDTSGPAAGAVFNTYAFKQAVSTADTKWLQASWDNFTDPQSSVVGYTVQFFQEERNSKNGSATLTPLTEPLALAANVTRLQVKTAPLEEGLTYFARVTAMNGAGMSSVVQGPPVTIDLSTAGTVLPRNVALMVVLCSVGCFVIGAVLSLLVLKGRLRRQRHKDKAREVEAKQLKAMMYALISHEDMAPGPNHLNGSIVLSSKAAHGGAGEPGDASDREVAFVFTDIESSTELSQQDAEAFKQLQEVHDQLMREGIAKHGGYEIITEGDSFQVAFSSAQEAMAFCVETQYRLVEQMWPKQVLALNACRLIRGPDGSVLFAGPRVRMGLHWAREGTVAVRLHNLTRHKVFAGPAVQIALDVSDAAHGGQILLTEDAAVELSKNMALAGFPIIRLCGLFQLPSVPCPVYLFSCTELVGKPLRREFPALRKIKPVWPLPGDRRMLPTLEYNIAMPPLPNASNNLAFAVLRLATYPKTGSSSSSAAAGARCQELPRPLASKFDEVFATHAQQFRGYLFMTHECSFKEGIWTVAFQNSMDALRFCHAIQMVLMQVAWPACAGDYFGVSVPSPDGRWLFHGPRVCTAIHESPAYFVSEDSGIDRAWPRRAMCFAGPAVMVPLVLTYAGRGGQVILSEAAWEAVKPTVTQHPGAVSIISLGSHWVSDDVPGPMALMEVMPTYLSRRSFSRVMTKRTLAPGYRDAPDPREPMTIVFIKNSKPHEVARAEKGSMAGAHELQDDDVTRRIQAYQTAVSLFGAMVRSLLHKYRGYECKEPEAGKFTLAFQHLDAAIRWACHVQEELLYLPWPTDLLEMEECRVQHDEAGALVWRGLRVRMGMAHGMVSNKKPLNSGRADYFGVLPNAAARVAALAAPGQVLFEVAAPPLTPEGQPLVQLGATTHLRLAYPPGARPNKVCAPGTTPDRALLPAAAVDARTRVMEAAKQPGASEADKQACEALLGVNLHAVGYFLLRGLDNPRLLYQAEGASVAGRQLRVNGDMWAPAAGYGPGALNSSFGSTGDSLRRNWGSWVEKTRVSWVSRHISPRPSTSPSSAEAAAFVAGGGAFSGGGRVPRTDSGASMSAASSSFAGGHVAPAAAGAAGPGGSRSCSAAAGRPASAAGRGDSSSAGAGHQPMVLDSPSGTLRSHSSVSAGGRGTHYLSGLAFHRAHGGSEAGRAGYTPRGLHLPGSAAAAASAAAGGLARSPRVARGPPCSSSNFGRSFVVDRAASPPQFHSSRSESAACTGLARSAAALIQEHGASPEPDAGASTSAPAAAAAAADATCTTSKAGSIAAWLDGTNGQLPGLHSDAAVPGSGAAAGNLIDPLLGRVHIPPVQTAPGPAAGLWTATASPSVATPFTGAGTTDSCGGSPFAVIQSDTPPSTLAASSGSCDALVKPLPQQQPLRQLQQRQRQESEQQMACEAGGEEGDGPASCAAEFSAWRCSGESCTSVGQPLQQQHQQPEQQQGPSTLLIITGSSSGNGSSGNGGRVTSGRPDSGVASLSTMTEGDDAQSLHQQLVSEQRAAEATMRGMLLTHREASSNSSLGASSGALGLLANMMPAAAGDAGTLRGKLLKPAHWLSCKLLRRTSSNGASLSMSRSASRQPTAAIGALDSDADGDEGGPADTLLAAAQQQHGMLHDAASPTSSTTVTPASTAPNSRACTGGGDNPLTSPGSNFARELAQTYVNVRHGSSTSVPVVVAPAGCAAASSTPDGGRSVFDAMLLEQQQHQLAVAKAAAAAAADARSDGGGRITYAESSYSPTHCQPSRALAVAWQQPDPSVQQQQEQPQALARAWELSQRAGQDPSTGAAAGQAAAAVDGPAAAEARVSASDVHPLLLPDSEAGAADGTAAGQQVGVAGREDATLKGAYTSHEGSTREEQQPQGQVQPLPQAQQQQPSPVQQHAGSTQAAAPVQPPEGVRDGALAGPETIQQIAQRPDVAALVVRAAASSGTPFTVRRDADADADSAVTCPHTASQEGRVPGAAGKGEAPRQQQHHAHHAHSPAEQLAELMQDARLRGQPVYSPGEYRDLMMQQQREMQLRSTGGLQALTEQQPQQVQQQQAPQSPRRTPQQQQQQPQQQPPPVVQPLTTDARQHPSQGRPSPLGNLGRGSTGVAAPLPPAAAAASAASAQRATPRPEDAPGGCCAAPTPAESGRDGRQQPAQQPELPASAQARAAQRRSFEMASKPGVHSPRAAGVAVQGPPLAAAAVAALSTVGGSRSSHRRPSSSAGSSPRSPSRMMSPLAAGSFAAAAAPSHSALNSPRSGPTTPRGGALGQRTGLGGSFILAGAAGSGSFSSQAGLGAVRPASPRSCQSASAAAGQPDAALWHAGGGASASGGGASLVSFASIGGGSGALPFDDECECSCGGVEGGCGAEGCGGGSGVVFLGHTVPPAAVAGGPLGGIPELEGLEGRTSDCGEAGR